MGTYLCYHHPGGPNNIKRKDRPPVDDETKSAHETIFYWWKRYLSCRALLCYVGPIERKRTRLKAPQKSTKTGQESRFHHYYFLDPIFFIKNVKWKKMGKRKSLSESLDGKCLTGMTIRSPSRVPRFPFSFHFPFYIYF